MTVPAHANHAEAEARAEAASLRERVAELQTELESHANQEASWKELMGSLRERMARLKNELLGVAQDIDGDCVCDVDGCECGGDGSVCGEALEAGCARCWATRLRQVAEGVDWPPRVLEERR